MKKTDRADSVSACFSRPCTSSHTLVEEKSHTLVEEKAVEAVALSSSEKDSGCDAPFSLYDGGTTNGAADAASLEAGAVVERLEASDEEEDTDDDDIKWVEMSMEYIRWILSQKEENHVVPPIEDYDIYSEEVMKSTVFTKKNIDERRVAFRKLHASLQAKHDDFFRYQAWVGEVFEKNGRVLVPGCCSKEELQQEINDVWAQYKEEYARDHPDDSDIEPDAE